MSEFLSSSTPGSSAGMEDVLSPWCIITSLVTYGADIYHITEEDFDHAVTWKDIRTPLHWSTQFDILPEWAAALSEIGVNFEQYLWENERHCKRAIRLQGALRSGYDEQVLELPSGAGLWCRRCRRSFCTKHDHSVFNSMNQSSPS